MVKVTFTLDDETVQRLRKIAERSRKPQSQVVREAVAQYSARDDKLTPEEQKRVLRVLDELGSKLPTRPREDVDRELRDLRRSRRTGWVRPWDR